DVEHVRELAGRARDVAPARPAAQWPRVVERIDERARTVAKSRGVDADAVPREKRRELRRAPPQILARRVVGDGAQALALGVAEDAREEDVGVLACRLEQNDVGARIVAPVLVHPGL